MIGFFTLMLVVVMILAAGLLASDLVDTWYARLGYWAVLLSFIVGIMAYAVMNV
jgi:hypothetical protein